MTTVWTPEKLAKLREIFPHYTTQECAEMLGSTAPAVGTKASRLRLRRSRAHILEPPKPGRVRYVSKSGIGGMVK